MGNGLKKEKLTPSKESLEQLKSKYTAWLTRVQGHSDLEAVGMQHLPVPTSEYGCVFVLKGGLQRRFDERLPFVDFDLKLFDDQVVTLLKLIFQAGASLQVCIVYKDGKEIVFPDLIHAALTNFTVSKLQLVKLLLGCGALPWKVDQDAPVSEGVAVPVILKYFGEASDEDVDAVL
jgi:hypothetical protein